jgi:site-specific recombinase XerD
MSDLALIVTSSFVPALSLVADSVRSPHTKRAYRSALTDFMRWCQMSGPAVFSKATVYAYRATLEKRNLSASSIKVQMSAIRRLAAEMADNGLLDPQTALVISKVSGPRRCGVRLGNWLSLHQVEDLLALPNPNTLKGKRDRAALSVLLGAGLRRGELCALKFEHLQQRDGRWVIADLVGKHERIRTVPVPNWCKAAIDIWARTFLVHPVC